VQKILNKGQNRTDRTGVGTKSIFGAQMRFNLKNQFPLLTTKQVAWKPIVEELLWMIKGQTDSKILNAKGVKIWDANGSKEFLKKIGFPEREVGDLGPIYGFQWRHFGAKYKSTTEFEGEGVDQLKDVIRLIKEDPFSRRILFSAWNASDIKQMALPPCHVLAQFYVHNNFLSCQLYQRSADMALGVPFNIASYSLLTYILAQICHLQPGEFIHTIGDAHIYNGHEEGLKKQLLRKPLPFPQVKIDLGVSDIDALKASDIVLSGYKSHEKIPFPMAV